MMRLGIGAQSMVNARVRSASRPMSAMIRNSREMVDVIRERRRARGDDGRRRGEEKSRQEGRRGGREEP